MKKEEHRVSKVLKRGLILALSIVLISFVGMGIIDFVVFIILALLLIIAAGVATIVRNQRTDKE